jgi:hypothetical protein
MTSGMTSAAAANATNSDGAGGCCYAVYLTCPSLFLRVDETAGGRRSWRARGRRSVRARYVFFIRNGTINCIYRCLELYQQLAHVVSVTALAFSINALATSRRSVTMRDRTATSLAR